MSIKLPESIAVYVDAANAGDADKGSACFSENATVLDEGKTLIGRKSIYDWMKKTKEEYNHITRPLKFREKSGEAVLTAELTGTFPGSPIVLEYHFELKNHLIQKLRIALPKRRSPPVRRSA